MNNEILPILDAYGKVKDFIVKHECEGCKRRRAKLLSVARKVDKSARDLLRRRRKK